MKKFILKCEPLSPVHIGSGEEIEVYEYIIITQKLYRIDLVALLNSLPEPDKLNIVNLLEKNIVSFRSFLFDRLSKNAELLNKVSLYSIPVLNAVYDFYSKKVDDHMNVLSVSLFQRSIRKPFVPGSSIKGAIRTAVLYNFWKPNLASQLKFFQRELRNNAWERKVLNYHYSEEAILSSKRTNQKKIEYDPFRALKISDSLNDFQTIILNARVHTKRKGSWQADKYQMLIESIYQAPFEVEVWFDEEWQKASKKKYNRLLELTPEIIIDSCRKFYFFHFKSESKRLLGNQGISNYYQKTLDPKLKVIIDDKSNLSFPLRLGWGSTFDAVTFSHAEGFNQVISYVKKQLSRPKSSVKLVQDTLPLGWVKATLIPQ